MNIICLGIWVWLLIMAIMNNKNMMRNTAIGGSLMGILFFLERVFG